MAKRFTVILVLDSGYKHSRVKADDWRQAEDIARELHEKRNPNEQAPGCAGVILGWPETWGG